MKTTILAAALVLLSTAATAGPTGSEFVRECHGDGEWGQGECLGFISAHAEDMLVRHQICMADNVTIGTNTKAVMVWLDLHPKELDKQFARVLVRRALRDIYRCG